MQKWSSMVVLKLSKPSMVWEDFREAVATQGVKGERSHHYVGTVFGSGEEEIIQISQEI